MTQQEINQKAREWADDNYQGRGFVAQNMAAMNGYIEGYNACALDSQNQIDKLTECLRDLTTRMDRCRNILQTSELNPGNWGMLDTSEARTLLATFTDKKS